MKTLYLECTLGVSGDMLLASLSDLLPEGARLLENAVAALGLPGVSLKIGEQMVQGIRTRTVQVLEETPQPLRHLAELTSIVRDAPEDIWPAEAKILGLEALTRLAEAEARVHNEPVERVHFHEVGAVDTVVDVMGAALLARATGAERIVASAVNLGSGFVTFSHGRFPVPAPACAELAKGMRTFASDAQLELATPTGLALVKTLATHYGPLPQGSILAVGYGSGTYSTGAYPTFLRAFLMDALKPMDLPEGVEQPARTCGGHGHDHEHGHGEDRGPVRGRGDVFGPHGHPHYGKHAHMTNGRPFDEDEDNGRSGHKKHGHD